jgi:hypothetical protein
MRRLGNGFLALAVGLVVVTAPAAGAQGGCITKLPIKAGLQSADPRDYRARFAPVDVASRGPVLRRVKLGLYTFKGRVMAERRIHSIQDQRSLRMRVHHRVPSGTYTLYAEGDPNASRSCGPKHWSRVVRIGQKKQSSPSESDSPSGSSDSSGSSDGANPDDQLPPDQRL